MSRQGEPITSEKRALENEQDDAVINDDPGDIDQRGDERRGRARRIEAQARLEHPISHRRTGPFGQRYSMKAARLRSVDAIPAWWSSALIPGGTFAQRMVTRVPSATGVSVVVTRIVPAKAGSSEPNTTSSTMRS